MEERRPSGGVSEKERERIIARARVKDTEKGFLVAYSVCKMSSQPCTHRILPPDPSRDV